jgi:hypothetical protein
MESMAVPTPFVKGWNLDELTPPLPISDPPDTGTPPLALPKAILPLTEGWISEDLIQRQSENPPCPPKPITPTHKVKKKKKDECQTNKVTRYGEIMSPSWRPRWPTPPPEIIYSSPDWITSSSDDDALYAHYFPP